jgi:hypothetical protein
METVNADIREVHMGVQRKVENGFSVDDPP